MKYLALSLGLLATASLYAGPCKEKHQALRQNRKALKQCTKTWLDSMRGDAPDPQDDCSAANSELITAIKELKACVREAKTQKTTQKP